MKRGLLLCLFLLLLPALPAQTGSPAIESLDTWLEGVRSQHDIPGLAVIVFRSDSVIARGVAGRRRSSSSAPLELRDRFQLGSNTKAITATLLASLVEEGKLSWTTPIIEVFPELRDSISADYRQITPDLLLSHHAGISAFDDSDAKDFRSIPRLTGTPRQQRAAFTAWVLHGHPAVSIGKGLYSNGGYTIAGAIAERLTGESWESLVQERVFNPLGVRATFAWSDPVDLDQPWGHRESRHGAKPLDPRNKGERLPPIIGPAGSVELCLDDYARFLQVHLRGLQGRDTPLLRASTIQHLHTSPVAPPDRYGLGWGMQFFEGAQSSVHVGSAGAFYAVAVLQPSQDLGIAIFANSGGERAKAATTEALKSLVRRYAAPLKD